MRWNFVISDGELFILDGVRVIASSRAGGGGLPFADWRHEGIIRAKRPLMRVQPRTLTDAVAPTG